MVKLLLMSDSHNQHDKIEIPSGIDIAVHCGDATGLGTKQEVEAFLKWYGSIDAKVKLFTPGNHDWLYEKDLYAAQALHKKYGIELLLESSYEYAGIKFYGYPYQPEFCNWAFNLPRGSEAMKRVVNAVPLDTDVLITHGPPFGILDAIPRHGGVEKLGCRLLKRRVAEVKPKIHCFGHIHFAYGCTGYGSTQFYNCALLNEQYGMANSPWEVEL